MLAATSEEKGHMTESAGAETNNDAQENQPAEPKAIITPESVIEEFIKLKILEIKTDKNGEEVRNIYPGTIQSYVNSQKNESQTQDMQSKINCHIIFLLLEFLDVTKGDKGKSYVDQKNEIIKALKIMEEYYNEKENK